MPIVAATSDLVTNFVFDRYMFTMAARQSKAAATKRRGVRGARIQKPIRKIVTLKVFTKRISLKYRHRDRNFLSLKYRNTTLPTPSAAETRLEAEVKLEPVIESQASPANVKTEKPVVAEVATTEVITTVDVVAEVQTTIVTTTADVSANGLAGTIKLGQEIQTVQVKVNGTSVGVKRRVHRPPKGFFTNAARFKFGWSPYYDHSGPTEAAVMDVANKLKLHHKEQHELESFMDEEEVWSGPAHASKGVTVDAIVRTLLSGATNNENALFVQAILAKRFPYLVDGKKVVGKIPNYHDIRLCSHKKLAKTLMPAGLNVKKAKYIKKCLDTIYTTNVSNRTTMEGVVVGNPINAADFMPGLLSMDFLNGKSKEEIFDYLISFEGIGVKTVCCILAFNYQLPVFAVDTHVFRMVKWLSWVPKDCNDPDKACMHLDHHLPDSIKYGLHQLFWHHGQLCDRCIAKNKPKSADFKKCICPLEILLDRYTIKTRSGIENEVAGDVSGAVPSNDDSEASLKPEKVRKSLKKSTSPKKLKPSQLKDTMPFAVMTVEEAALYDYVLIEFSVDDNFNADRQNITNTNRARWVRREFVEDLEEDHDEEETTHTDVNMEDLPEEQDSLESEEVDFDVTIGE